MEAMNDNLPARLWRKVYPRLEPIMLGIAMTATGAPLGLTPPRVAKTAADALTEDARAVGGDRRRAVRKCLDETRNR